jgi:hypothetical protein
VLPAVLSLFLCTACIRKIIVLFVKQDDILMARTHRLCMYMWCVGVRVLFFFYLLISSY